MTDTNHERLSAALRRIAGQTSPAVDPTAEVVRRAGRLRTRRIAVTAVVSAAALGLVVPAGLALFPSSGQGIKVATTTATNSASATSDRASNHSVSQATRGSDGIVETTIDLDRLPKGPAPKVPWFANGVIHDGGREIRLTGVDSVHSLQKVADGYVVLSWSDDPHYPEGVRELFLVRPDGKQTRLDRVPIRGDVFAPAVSADGKRIAWSHVSGDLLGSQPLAIKLFVADVDTGRVLATKELTGDASKVLEVRAFLGSKLIVDRHTNRASKPVKIWDPNTGSLQDWYDAYQLAGLDASQTLAAVDTSAPGRGKPCFTVLELPRQRERWTSCDYALGGVFFSPDGRFVAAPNTPDTPETKTVKTHTPGDPKAGTLNQPQGVPNLYVLAARTGERVLRINGTAPSSVAWEPGGSFVFDASDHDSTVQALVRCTPAGDCELAGRPLRIDNSLPYVIAVQR
jgi:hypothetical protein